ncbi:MAG: hypothetical protein GY854_17115 [Deltaproteobacteria bacterium]|nr:hypothetical protein [Deltaproteobacteria bacterium]
MKNAIEKKNNRKSLRTDERGLSTVEYIIILVLIAVAGIGLWQKFGTEIETHITNSTSTVKGM